MLKTTLSLAALTLALTAGAAAAQNAPRGAGLDRMFERLDTDGNGSITRAEVDAAAGERFDGIDANDDGKVDADELFAHMQARRSDEAIRDRAERVISRLDADGDGALTPAELPMRRLDRMFERFDADGDGAISREEAETARAEWQERRGSRRPGRDG